MKTLTDRDFETLVDLIFSTSGWRRQSPVGKAQELLDIDLVLPHPPRLEPRGNGSVDIAVALFVGCALGFGVGYGVRARVSRKRRRYTQTYGL